jgi:hypothetical protein
LIRFQGLPSIGGVVFSFNNKAGLPSSSWSASL